MTWETVEGAQAERGRTLAETLRLNITLTPLKPQQQWPGKGRFGGNHL
jgi:hypothetical protein